MLLRALVLLLRNFASKSAESILYESMRLSKFFSEGVRVSFLGTKSTLLRLTNSLNNVKRLKRESKRVFLSVSSSSSFS